VAVDSEKRINIQKNEQKLKKMNKNSKNENYK
jgi:hypothetical protein